MMLEKFTLEEINLCAIYDTSSRTALIGSLVTGLHGVDDPEMIEIFTSALEKLESVTDAEFARIGFYAADEFDEYIVGEA